PYAPRLYQNRVECMTADKWLVNGGTTRYTCELDLGSDYHEDHTNVIILGMSAESSINPRKQIVHLEHGSGKYSFDVRPSTTGPEYLIIKIRFVEDAEFSGENDSSELFFVWVAANWLDLFELSFVSAFSLFVLRILYLHLKNKIKYDAALVQEKIHEAEL